MRVKSIRIAVLSVLFCLQGVYAGEEVILSIAGKEYTNLDVAKHIYVECKFREFDRAAVDGYIIKRMADRTAQKYAAFSFADSCFEERHGIFATEQEIIEEIARYERSDIYGLGRIKGKIQLSAIEKERRELRMRYNARIRILADKRVEYIDPDYKKLTKQDIEEFVDDYRNTFHPAKLGQREAVFVRGIHFIQSAKGPEDYPSLRKKTEELKKRLDKGEVLEEIADEYDGLYIGNGDEVWLSPHDLQKEGLSALVPWSLLKGKYVLAKFKMSAGAPIMIVKVLDYKPNTRTDIGMAFTVFSDKHVREEAMRLARRFKRNKVLRESKELREIKRSIKWLYKPAETSQKIVEAYHEFIE